MKITRHGSRWALPCATLLVAAISGSAQAQSCTSAPSGAVAWWDGDAVLAGTAADLLGAAPATNETVVVEQMTGTVGMSFDFPSTAAPYLRTTAPALNTSGAFTAEAWIKPTAAASGAHQAIVAEIGTGAVSGQFMFRVLNDGLLQIVRKTGANGNQVNTQRSTVTLNDDEWAHVVAVYFGGSNFQIWINGQNRSAPVLDSIYNSTATPVTTIGAADDGVYPFVGQIDEVTLYSRGLSSSEIAAIFNAGAGGKCKCTPPPPDAAHWWTADQVCGTDAMDSTGGQSARMVNTTTTSGHVGQSFNFNGTGYMTTGVPVVATTGPFSLEAWIYPTAAALGGIISETGTTTGSPVGQFSFRMRSTGALQLYRKPGTTIDVDVAQTDTTGVAFGRWSHVVATYDGTGMRIFINGTERSTALYPSTYTPTQPVQTTIGAGEADTHKFRGRIDEATVYRRALTLGEITQLFNAGLMGRCVSAANQFPCITGSGDDLTLDSQMNGVGFFDAPQMLATDGDLHTLTIRTPNLGLVGAIPLLFINIYPNGFQPGPNPLIPDLHLRSGGVMLSGLGVLPPQGTPLFYRVPAGLAGFSARFQAGALQGPTFAVSEARDVRFR